jgi:hypothetical protein
MGAITLQLDDHLAARLVQEAQQLGLSPEARVAQILDRAVAPAPHVNAQIFGQGIAKLHGFIQHIPAITAVASSAPDAPYWWVKVRIDLNHRLAWRVVQELAWVCNQLSVEAPLPTVFKPLSPPPYLNGGPHDYLSWVLESTIPFLDAGYVADILEGHLPRPVQHAQEWLLDDERNDH